MARADVKTFADIVSDCQILSHANIFRFVAGSPGKKSGSTQQPFAQSQLRVSTSRHAGTPARQLRNCAGGSTSPLQQQICAANEVREMPPTVAAPVRWAGTPTEICRARSGR